uniref:Reverse transcriptase domain-containing protein n=1 Tax=Tanacetum cinerariifolium TaxID=118510 RepID=A0A6L2J141_TANCI|nr:hypothetical protein [Tanacetum cinerariifolium]
MIHQVFIVVITHAQPEDSNELFQKLLEDLKELAEYVNSPSRDHPTLFDDNEEHSVQNKEYLENSSNEIAASNSNQEKEGPSQDSNIRQLIREECSIEVYEEQRQNMENTILELVEICRQKELYCMHDNVDDLIESALNSKLISINSQRLNKEKRKSRMSWSNRDDDDFEDIEYVEASLPDPEIVSVEEENGVEEEEVDLEDVFQIQDVILREKLLSINRLIDNIESLNENPTPDQTRSGNTTTHADNSLLEYDSFCFEIEPDQERLINVVKKDISDDLTNDPLFEEVDLFITFDNSIPSGIKNFAYDSEGDICFLEALLIDDFIPFPNNESSESDFDNPSFLRPLSEPPDAEFDSKEEISVVINTIDELECLDQRDEFDVSINEDDDYSSFMFSFLLSAESKDTIFDPGVFV